MASRFGGDTADYGTLSGHSRGFSSGKCSSGEPNLLSR